jgi:hypothetical protein
MLLAVLTLNAFVFLFCVVLLHRTDNLKLCSILFWFSLFYLFIFVLRPFFVVIDEYTFVYHYIGFFPSEEVLIKTVFVTLIGYVAFALGSVYVGQPPTPKNFDFRVVLNKRATITTCIFLMPIAIYSIMSTIGGVSFDGSTQVIMDRIDGIAINVNKVGYVTEFRNILPSILIMLYVVTKRSRSAVFLILIFVLYRFYVGHGRFNIVMLFFGLGLVEHYIFKTNIINLKNVILGSFVVLIFVVAGENRQFFKTVLIGEEQIQFSLSEDKKLLEGMDFANFEYLTYIVRTVPEYTGTYNYGVQYLQLFTEPLPRKYWKDKPVGQPIKFYSLNDYGNWVGLTQSIFGDGWQNGGFAGLFITLFLFGFLLTLLNIKMITASPFTFLIWICILPYSIQLFRDGGIVPIFKFVLFSSLPFFFYKFVVFTDSLVSKKNIILPFERL